jgi:hypothetical protein
MGILFMKMYIARFGETFGPYTADEVRTDLAGGCLLPTDLALCDGSEEWVPLGSISWILKGEPPPRVAHHTEFVETQKI